MRNFDAEEQQYEDEEQIRYIRAYMNRKRERKIRRALLWYEMQSHLRMTWKCLIGLLTGRRVR